MSPMATMTDLIVEMSDEQQEMISGGNSLLSLINISNNSVDTVFGSSQALAGPTGASANSMGGAQSIDSGSISSLVASVLDNPPTAI
jgi:hypothetical protein